MQIEYMPGTLMPWSMMNSKAFELFEPMISATGGLSLSQVCSITGLETSTIQNWIKRGLVAKPIEKKYYERQLARILLINSLRDSMQLDKIQLLLKHLNGLVDDEADDIIREGQLYNYLCTIISSIDFESGLSDSKISQAVKDTIADYIGPFEDSSLKLYKGLTLMAVAFVSGVLKNKADTLYNELLN